jgi:hypothetical protein
LSCAKSPRFAFRFSCRVYGVLRTVAVCDVFTPVALVA